MSNRNEPVVHVPAGRRAGDEPEAGRIVRDQEKAEPVRRVSLVAWGSTYLAIKVGIETIPPPLTASSGRANNARVPFQICARCGVDHFTQRPVRRRG